MNKVLQVINEMSELYNKLSEHEKFKYLFINNIKKIEVEFSNKKENLIKNIALKLFLATKENRIKFFEACAFDHTRALNIDKVLYTDSVNMVVSFSDGHYRLAFKINNEFFLEFSGFVTTKWWIITKDEFLKSNSLFNQILDLVTFLYNTAVEEVIKLKDKEIEVLKKREEDLRAWYEQRIKNLEDNFAKREEQFKNEICELENTNKRLRIENERLILRLEKIQEILNDNLYISEE